MNNFTCFVLYQVKKDKEAQAEKVIRLLHRNDQKKLEEEMREIREIHSMDSANYSFFDHFRERSTRRAFMIDLIQFFFFQFTGSNAILFYTSKIFEEAKLNIDPGIASIIVVSSQIFGTAISSICVDRVGRRIMLMISSVLMTLSHALIGTYFVLKESNLISEQFSFMPIASLCLYEVAFGSGIGPVSYVSR